MRLVSLEKILWACASVGTLVLGYASGVPPLPLIAVSFAAAIPMSLLLASTSELEGGFKAVASIAICVAIGSFVPPLLGIVYAACCSVTWYSITLNKSR